MSKALVIIANESVPCDARIGFSISAAQAENLASQTTLEGLSESLDSAARGRTPDFASAEPSEWVSVVIMREMFGVGDLPESVTDEPWTVAVLVENEETEQLYGLQLDGVTYETVATIVSTPTGGPILGELDQVEVESLVQNPAPDFVRFVPAMAEARASHVAAALPIRLDGIAGYAPDFPDAA